MGLWAARPGGRGNPRHAGERSLEEEGGEAEEAGRKAGWPCWPGAGPGAHSDLGYDGPWKPSLTRRPPATSRRRAPRPLELPHPWSGKYYVHTVHSSQAVTKPLLFTYDRYGRHYTTRASVAGMLSVCPASRVIQASTHRQLRPSLYHGHNAQLCPACQRIRHLFTSGQRGPWMDAAKVHGRHCCQQG